MSPAQKKKAVPVSPRLAPPIAFLWGRGRPLTLAVLLVGMLAGSWYLAWHKVRDRVLEGESYRVDPENVQITPLPEWIHSDVRAEVFRNASLDQPLSIMDDDLAQRIERAFSLHPWIADVRSVTKHHPSRVEVELVYRRPVCMVQVRQQLLPVDGQGVLLPTEDFSPVEKSRYPRLIAIDTLPVATAGECWGDARVVGGAEIAEALIAVWGELKLRTIVPSDPLATGIAEEHTYTLQTRGGTRIFWGRAPGSDAPGTLPAAEKVARLQEYAKRYGALDTPGAPQELDVYDLRVSSRPQR